jgi:hypothetical protein
MSDSRQSSTIPIRVRACSQVPQVLRTISRHRSRPGYSKLRAGERRFEGQFVDIPLECGGRRILCGPQTRRTTVLGSNNHGIFDTLFSVAALERNAGTAH